MKRTTTTNPTMQMGNKKEVTCRRIPLALFIGMFPLASCVLNAVDGRTFSVRFHTLHKEDQDRFNFAGFFTDDDRKGREFTGFYNANEGQPRIYF